MAFTRTRVQFKKPLLRAYQHPSSFSLILLYPGALPHQHTLQDEEGSLLFFQIISLYAWIFPELKSQEFDSFPMTTMRGSPTVTPSQAAGPQDSKLNWKRVTGKKEMEGITQANVFPKFYPTARE